MGAETTDFVNHMLRTDKFALSESTLSPRRSSSKSFSSLALNNKAVDIPGMTQFFPQAAATGSSLLSVNESFESVKESAESTHTDGLIAKYVYEVTGGNPEGVVSLLH